MNTGSLIGWIVGVIIGMGLSVSIKEMTLIERSGVYPISLFICIISALVFGIAGTIIY